MFPKAHESLLHHVVRIGFRTGPLARDEPEPGAVLGEPGPPILTGMGIRHGEGTLRSETEGCVCLPSGKVTRESKVVKAVANPSAAP